MNDKIKEITKPFLRKDLPEISPGDTVKVFQKIKDKDKERVQAFEGVVIAKKHKKEIGATITVRKVIKGIGVEKIFPLNSPTIEKIEIVKRSKVRRAKLYYLRKAKGKKARLKRRTKKKREGAPQEKEETKKEEKQEGKQEEQKGEKGKKEEGEKKKE